MLKSKMVRAKNQFYEGIEESFKNEYKSGLPFSTPKVVGITIIIGIILKYSPKLVKYGPSVKQKIHPKDSAASVLEE